MPRVGFEPAISTSEQPKTVLASDLSAVETGIKHYYGYKIKENGVGGVCSNQGSDEQYI
jgi:hypothetical protein